MTNRWTSLCVLLVCSLAGCASDKSTIQKASAANDQLAPTVMSDQQLSQYIQTLGNRVVTAAKAFDAEGKGPSSHKKSDSAWMFSNQMQFHLVNSNVVNAFTTGGQHMYVYTALFQLCDTEEELAAVMSHEFAHVYCRHVQQGTDRQTGMTVFAYGAAGAGYLYGGTENGASYADTASKGASALGQFAGLSYTRKNEAEADKWGFQFYSRAGWDPARFGDFFQKMIDNHYDTAAGSATAALSSDHPTLISRVQAAKAELPIWQKQYGDKFRQQPVASADQFAQLKARALAISKSMPATDGAKQAQKLLASFSSCVAPVDQPEQTAAKAELLKNSK